MSENGTRLVQFGIFEIDLRAGELRRNGSRVKLQEQPFQILCLLLQRPGQVVTREELQRKLWPADTFVDFDHGLNSAIRRLRNALGDSAENPRFVETVARRGYRFLLPMEDEVGSVAPALPSTTHPKWWRILAAKPLRQTAFPVTLTVVACAVFAVAGWRYHSRQEASLPPPQVVPLTSVPDRAECSSLSPDGNRLAFARHSDSPNLSGIYITHIGSDSYLQVTRSTEDWCPVWSPDSQYLAFSRYGYQEHSLYLVSALGGEERKLYSGAPAAPALDWSRDGKVIAFSAANPEPGNYSIFSLALETLETRRLTEPPAGYQDWAPVFSPDGRQLAFIRANGKHTVAEIYIVSANGDRARRLTFDGAWIPSRPAWTPDGQSLLFSSTRSGLPTLWRILASGGSPVQITQVGVKALHPSVSGHRLAFEQSMGNSSLWNLHVAGLGKKDARRQVTASRGRNGEAELSPDGTRIAFISDRAGSDEIYICNADGTNLVQLTRLGNARTPGRPRWSPDGQQIVFDSVMSERSAIFVTHANGGQPRPLTGQASDNLNPSWSHDGQWIYFTSNRTGQWQIWRMPSQGGKALQITEQGGFAGVESSDGRFIYYAKTAADPDIWKLRLEDRQEIVVSPPIHVSQWTSWALVDKGIFFVREGAEVHPVLRYLDFATARVKEIAPLDKQPWPLWISATGDGKFVLYQEIDIEVSNVMLLENFR